MLDVFRAADARVDQAVGAGECDITAARAAQQGNHREEQGGRVIRHKDFGGNLADRGLGSNRDDRDRNQDDSGEHLGDLIHHAGGVFGKEDADCDNARNDTANLLGDTEQGIEAERRAADISDVECEAAERNHEGHDKAESGKHLIGDVLPAHPRNTDDRPDVGLGDDVEEDGTEDNRRERR